MKRLLSLRRRQRGKVSTWIFAGFAAVALFFLLAEHRAHLFGWLPFLLLGGCVLMHMFHGGHGGHGQHRSDDTPGRRDQDAAPGEGAPKPGASASSGTHHH
ncbi:MAG: DUF2933 domain-containing protein [Polaromonas sp.]|jgi:hypothetical protein|uniref:DUF2933 domain-containing protein n=1 Tax=Polaromonas sp. TaxID=1869339 RepID=UPI00248A24B1|nr:DUF2933 domain-containing protein [Polaromonas sp.]MDI1268088.1 DUF2933 domain-containing protein [Polaromonas sp.]